MGKLGKAETWGKLGRRGNNVANVGKAGEDGGFWILGLPNVGKVGDVGGVGEIGKVGEVGNVGKFGKVGDFKKVGEVWGLEKWGPWKFLTLGTFGKLGKFGKLGVIWRNFPNRAIYRHPTDSQKTEDGRQISRYPSSLSRRTIPRKRTAAISHELRNP